MSKIFLSQSTVSSLEAEHRVERDGRVRDRIKAVLLSSEGWDNRAIAQALRIRPETVSEHLREYGESLKLKPENGGSIGRLNEMQAQALIRHLETQTYVKALEICAYVAEHYQLNFTVQGMTHWLHRHGFSYKQPKGAPSKASPEKQGIFIKQYEQLMNSTPEDEPVLFGDGVHPTMATKISYGWIKRGTEKIIPTTASRTRINLFGALNLQTMELITESYETINSVSMGQYFQHLRNHYTHAPNIHLILDQGPYNTSKETKESAKKHGIIIHYLPTYSPNLNPIERCWKIMNEKVRNNHFFQSAKDFRLAIYHFFAVTWPEIAHSMVERVNDNFETVAVTSSV